MAKQKNPPRIPLPHGWSRSVKSAMLHVLSLAQYAMAYTHSWAVNDLPYLADRASSPCAHQTSCRSPTVVRMILRPLGRVAQRST